MKQLKDYILKEVALKKLNPEQAIDYINQIEGNQQCSPKECEWAVIGMACRLSGAEEPEEFWSNLLAKRDCVGSFPKNRIDDYRYVNQHLYQQSIGLNCRVGSYLDRIDEFDHVFFDVTPAEARVMDPAQRIFLEVAYEAIENAGLTESDLKNSKTGVYVGYSVNEDNYMEILAKDDPNALLGNLPAMLAYRLSYLFDLKGPTMIIDTSCSSSLVAVHQACQAIADGDCEQAIVGGVNVRIFPAIREISNLGIEAFDGRCRTFDEKANGTNIGDGVVAIIIKRKDLAVKDGDFIHAVIKGSAINSDGRSNGMTAPNPISQTEVILEAWKRAKLEPEKISFIESHGTATKLGDPIEINGLTYAFNARTNKRKICPLGAVKTNIGHLEAAAGITGLLKVLLCLKYRQLPPNIHYQKPNPLIDLENTAVYPNDKLLEWGTDKKLVAGVSSFGISGTNCHMVVEEYKNDMPHVTPSVPIVFFFSAKNTDSLKDVLKKYISFMKRISDHDLMNMATTLAIGRNHYHHRLAIVSNTAHELRAKIEKAVAYFQDGSVLSDLEDENIYYRITNESIDLKFLNEKEGDVSFYRHIKHYFSLMPIKWEELFSCKTRKMPLPSYAFNKKRHWPKLEVEKENDAQFRIQSLYYNVEWQQESNLINHETEKPGVSHSQEGTWIILLRDNSQHISFFNHCLNQGVDCVRVFSSSEYLQIDNATYTIDPENEDDYSALLTAIAKSGKVRISGFVHMWDCCTVGGSMETFDAIKNSQRETAFSIFHLIRVCNDVIPDMDFKLVTLTSFAQKVDGSEKLIDPSRMPSLGINKVVSQEFPKVQTLALDTDLDYIESEWNEMIFREIFTVNPYSNTFVALRHGKRYLQTLEQLNLNELEPSPLLIREGGVYVIVGGSGYLGLETALYLATKSNVKIALLGRRKPEDLTEKQRNTIKKLEQMGTSIIYLEGDVTNEAKCQELINLVHQKFGNINGMFIAMKNISHKLIVNVPANDFKNNILSKLKGVWLLDKFSEQDNLDFLATFSSISSLTGGPTGADCCASNLFLDSFNDYRLARGKYTITMNYTLIEADDGSLLSDRMTMIPPITKEEYAKCLDIFMTKNLSFAVVVDFDNQVMNLVLPFMKIRFSEKILNGFHQGGKQVRRSEAKERSLLEKHSSDHMTFDEISLLMKKIWMDVLGYETIADDANFFDLGGDSISAVKLIHLCKIQLQVELQVSDLYAHPIFSSLCSLMMGELAVSEEDDEISRMLKEVDMGILDPSESKMTLK